MSDTRETIGGRKRIGPEDEAREDQMEDDGPAIQSLPQPVVNDGLIIEGDDDGTTAGDLPGQEGGGQPPESASERS
jgi:hypothetical protein